MGILYLGLWTLIGVLGIAWPSAAILALWAVTGLIGYLLALKGGAPFTDEAPVHVASRWPGNNLIFPTQIAVFPTRVIRYKKRLIGHNEESINIAQIASVKIQTRLLWSDIFIESTGGANPIASHGHTNSDALAIKAAIDRLQQHYFHERAAPPRDDGGPRTAQAGSLLRLSLYSPSSDRAAGGAPARQVILPADLPAESRLERLVRLLNEGGPGSRVEVDQIDPPSTEPEDP
jgi:hypothetical protein